MEELFPDCLVHTKLLNCVVCPGKAKLLEWEAAIRMWFIHRNGPYVAVNTVNEDNALNVSTFKGQIDKLCQVVKEVSDSQGRLLEHFAAMDHRNDARFEEAFRRIDAISTQPLSAGDNFAAVPAVPT